MQKFNSELALKLSKVVHDECKDVPHDIGVKLACLVEAHQPVLHKTDVSGSLPPMAEIKRLCDLIVNSPSSTTIKGDIESMAFEIGHHPAVLNFTGGNDR